MCDGFIIRSRYERPLEPEQGAGLYILQLVMMEGFDSWVLKYAHLQASYVNPGDRVKRGQPIAVSGKTGELHHLPPYLHVDLQDLRHQWKAVQLEG